jgi:hypothetical protein
MGRMEQNYTYFMFYEHLCRICYKFNKEEKHDCYAKVNVDSINNHYQAQLKNNDNATKWRCPHTHENKIEAIECARGHLHMHRSGECNCAYFKQPLPEWLKNQKTTQLYVLHHPVLKAWKIGVTGSGKTERLQQHYDEGWVLKVLWVKMAGVQAYTIEQKVLEHWRKIGILPFLTKQQMPQGGWTETASELQYTLAHMIKLVNHIVKEAGPPKVLKL